MDSEREVDAKRRRDRRVDRGLSISTGAAFVALLAVIAAALRIVLGPVMDAIGMVLVAGAMLGLLVGAGLLLSAVPAALRERHRRGMAAVRRLEDEP